MKSPIIGTEGSNHSSSKKGYRSDAMHHLRQEDREPRSLHQMRDQSPQPDRGTSTATQRSQAIPSAFPDRIRNSQHRAQHWNQRGRFGFHDGNRATAHPSRLGEHHPIPEKPDAPGDVDQRTHDRGRSLGERNLSPDPSRLVTRAGMGGRLRAPDTTHARQRKSSSQTILRAAPANPMPHR